MGVFDFLYKSPRPRGRAHDYRSRRIGYPGSTPAHFNKNRTATYVNKNSSLPDNFQDEPRTNKQYGKPDLSVNSSYRQRRDRSKPEHENALDYYNKSKQEINDDDFTRLSRLEVKIDNYIKRHNEIAEELDNIRSNLYMIYKEFNQEYESDIIANNKNKHIVELGERILAKLDSFKMNNCPLGKKAPGSYIFYHPEQEKEMINAKLKQPQQQPAIKKILIPNKEIDDKESKLIKVTINDNNNWQPLTPTTYTLARATYAIVDNSAPNSPNGNIDSHQLSPLSHYKSTPALNKPPSSPILEQQLSSTPTNSSYEPQSLSMLNKTMYNINRYSPVMIDLPSAVRNEPSYCRANSISIATSNTTNTNLNSNRSYMNISILSHSDHPLIENCLRRIESLRPRILAYKAEHKYGMYKQFDDEINDWVKKLRMIDCSKDALFASDKNIALCELHNLVGALERSIECSDPECITCNSFMYKPEVSV